MKFLISDSLVSVADQQIIEDVSAVRVYFLSQGRNAWHYTWSQQYRATDALHTRLADAKAAAERHRKQGSVFYISERPAIAARTERGTFVAVHDGPNAGASFDGWTVTQRALDPWGRYRPHYDIRPGIMAGVLLRALARSSGHWDLTPGYDGRVLLASSAIADFEPIRAELFRRYQSEAVGVKYSLCWYANGTGTKATATKRAVNNIRRRLELNSPASAARLSTLERRSA